MRNCGGEGYGKVDGCNFFNKTPQSIHLHFWKTFISFIVQNIDKIPMKNDSQSISTGINKQMYRTK